MGKGVDSVSKISRWRRSQPKHPLRRPKNQCDTCVVNYEWDKQKSVDNLAKHKVSFEEAKTVFDDPLYVEFYDPDHSIDEHRFVIVGKSDQRRLLIVAYTERSDRIRLISAREATAVERKNYEEG